MRNRKVRLLSLLLATVMLLGLLAGCSSDGGEKKSVTKGGDKDSIVIATSGETPSQAPLYQPLTMRAFNAGLQNVEVNDGGSLYFENVSWAE